MFDGVLILGKELRRDPDRAVRELRARAAAASVASRLGARRVLCLEAPLRGQDEAGSVIVGRFLAELGVPTERTTLLQVSRSTREEALIGSRIARAHGWRRLLVVTAAYHVPRARRFFEEHLGPGGVAVHAPEALLGDAGPIERRWIAQGSPTPEVMRFETRVEAIMSLLARALKPVPGSVRIEAEVIAGALFRRVDADRRVAAG